MMLINSNIRHNCSRGCALALAFFALTVTSCQKSQPTPTSTSATQTSSSQNSATASRPSFKGLIKNVSMYPVPGQPGNLAVSLVVSVSNAGADSTATGWRLDLESRGSSVRSFEPVHVNGVVELPGTSKTVDLGKEDLALMASQAPIAKGGSIDGVLTFVVPQTSEQNLTGSGTNVLLSFKDVLGNAYQTPKIVLGGKANRFVK